MIADHRLERYAHLLDEAGDTGPRPDPGRIQIEEHIMTASPTSPDENRPARNPGDELLTLHEACRPSSACPRHPALLAPPRLRTTQLPDRPARPLLAQRRLPVAHRTDQSPTGRAEQRHCRRSRGMMSHGQHREKAPRHDGACLASALPHACRRTAQQDLRPQGRRRTVPRLSRELPGHRHVRRPHARAPDRRRMDHRWLEGQAHLKPTTYARYAGIIRKHIEPTWAK